MEDVVVLDELMRNYPGDRLQAFEQYSKNRNPDAEAICDLAMYNYIEVRRRYGRGRYKYCGGMEAWAEKLIR